MEGEVSGDDDIEDEVIGVDDSTGVVDVSSELSEIVKESEEESSLGVDVEVFWSLLIVGIN